MFVLLPAALVSHQIGFGGSTVVLFLEHTQDDKASSCMIHPEEQSNVQPPKDPSFVPNLEDVIVDWSDIDRVTVAHFFLGSEFLDLRDQVLNLPIS